MLEIFEELLTDEDMRLTIEPDLDRMAFIFRVYYPRSHGQRVHISLRELSSDLDGCVNRVLDAIDSVREECEE